MSFLICAFILAMPLTTQATFLKKHAVNSVTASNEELAIDLALNELKKMQKKPYDYIDRAFPLGYCEGLNASKELEIITNNTSRKESVTVKISYSTNCYEGR